MKCKKIINTKKMVLSALLLALGMILPMLTMQIPTIGNMLLPMHIPVLLCGFICGAPYGAMIGFALPIIKSIVFGTPILMPNALAMSFELLCYGFFSGFFYCLLKKRKGQIYVSLILTMFIGRVAWGCATYILYYILGNRLTWKIFLTQAFINSILGIIIQLMIVPYITRIVKVYIGENDC